MTGRGGIARGIGRATDAWAGLCAAACLAAWAAAGGAWAQETAPSAVSKDAEEAEADRLVSELRLRGLAGAEDGAAGPEERALLVRIRGAEAAGAVRGLRARLPSLAGLVVEQRVPGSRFPRRLLTRQGFDRWLRFRTQEAIAYLEGRGVAAKDVFALRTPGGRALFSQDGLLSAEGEEFLARAESGQTTSWLTASGELQWSRPRRPRPARGGGASR